MKIVKEKEVKPVTPEEMTLDIIKGVAGVASELIGSKGSGSGTVLLKVDANGEIDAIHQSLLIVFLQRTFGDVRIKPTAEGMELSWGSK